jgi:hypothetical protein
MLVTVTPFHRLIMVMRQAAPLVRNLDLSWSAASVVRSVHASAADMRRPHWHVGFVPLAEVGGKNYRETRVVFMLAQHRSVCRLRPSCPLEVDHKIAPNGHRIAPGR